MISFLRFFSLFPLLPQPQPANETIGASAIPPPGEWGSASGGGGGDDDADAIGGSSERPYGRSYDEFHDAHAADDTGGV